MIGDVKVCKIFTFDSSHQLIGHKGKCANVHGHTYKLEVVLKGKLRGPEDESNEGFVMDFSDLKNVVNQLITEKLDHSFIAAGNEPILSVLEENKSKVFVTGFRTTAENMCMYICYKLLKAGLPIWSVKLWETPSSWAEVLASDIPIEGPTYLKCGDCDCE